MRRVAQLPTLLRSRGSTRLLSSSLSGERPRVCLILGAGAGIGFHVARRFAKEGFVACLARRSNKAGLDAAVKQIEDEGGACKGFMVNAHEPGAIEALVEQIETQVPCLTPGHL
jgi:NAD(P)-dependent dehydrogenase (short-subunit alcohol dehydrogenase family)